MKYAVETKEESRQRIREKAKRIGVWRKWYAWHPVFADHKIIWLETIERRYDYLPKYDYWQASYRLQSQEQPTGASQT